MKHENWSEWLEDERSSCNYRIDSSCSNSRKHTRTRENTIRTECLWFSLFSLFLSLHCKVGCRRPEQCASLLLSFSCRTTLYPNGEVDEEEEEVGTLTRNMNEEMNKNTWFTSMWRISSIYLSLSAEKQLCIDFFHSRNKFEPSSCALCMPSGLRRPWVRWIIVTHVSHV